MSSTWSGPGHEHDYSILTAFPVKTGGAVVSWTDYRECACGDRVPAAVTEISVPRFGDDGVQRLHAAMKQEPAEPPVPCPEAS